MTINDSVEGIIYKEKGSKFIGYLFSVTTEDEVQLKLKEIYKKYKDARHCSYAYRLGSAGLVYRVNDDGEPSNTAGQPIYRQLLAFDVTEVLLIVIRYFGGVKLGVGGLIKSYKATAEQTLNKAVIVENKVEVDFTVGCSYEYTHKVMKLIRAHKLTIKSQEMHLDSQFILCAPVGVFKEVITAFKELRSVKVTF
ncbi:MAG: IMPACT family protein [Wenyingzhuangia sp.]